ncbi:hypothetical protein DL96DRAFT_1495766 [Flagelloscypha sp. PMI_526]|nr:hypothetical protein DL96DRAFT_1495766 [Flagelloscypha sp. PMI_526]
MVCHDQTELFRSSLKSLGSIQSSTKRRKLSDDLEPSASKQFTTQAQNVLSSINTLTNMLSALRRPYLNVDARTSPMARHSSQGLDITGDPSTWSRLKSLTNEERDAIDLHARLTLSRCRDKVREMEDFEKRRSELVEKEQNPLLRFLPSRLREDDSSLASKALAAHHASITWYLTRRLTEASQAQKEMQEERVKRQTERNSSLGSAAGLEALSLGVGQSSSSKPLAPTPSGSVGGWLGQTPSNLIASAIGASPSGYQKNSYTADTTPPPPSFEDFDDDDDDIELTESQIQQFEQENAEMLQTVQDNLRAVQQAESRLVDISALQMELVTHLTQQAELTEQLYEDAISTTSMVERGNEQLKEAARRGKDTRLFLLFFLIGASLSLLFVHYY